MNNKEIIPAFSLIKSDKGFQIGIMLGLLKGEKDMDTDNLQGAFIPLETLNKAIELAKSNNKNIFLFNSPYEKSEVLVFEQFIKKEGNQNLEKTKEEDIMKKMSKILKNK